MHTAEADYVFKRLAQDNSPFTSGDWLRLIEIRLKAMERHLETIGGQNRLGKMPCLRKTRGSSLWKGLELDGPDVCGDFEKGLQARGIFCISFPKSRKLDAFDSREAHYSERIPDNKIAIWGYEVTKKTWVLADATIETDGIIDRALSVTVMQSDPAAICEILDYRLSLPHTILALAAYDWHWSIKRRLEEAEWLIRNLERASDIITQARWAVEKQDEA